MARLGLSILWIAAAFALAHAAPARPLYEPNSAPKPPAPVTVNLNGTAWLGKYLATRIFIFEADGTLSYTSAAKTGTVFKNRGFWKVEGKNLYFEHYVNPNQVLMEFRGTITDANNIVGEAIFLKGNKEQRTLQRITP